VATDWRELVKPSLLELEPYHPGASLEEVRRRYGLDEIVKLNWNEGLLGPFPGVAEAVAAATAEAWMYPAQAYGDLRRALGAWLDVPPERIVPGHGIQSLVTTLAAAMLLPGDRVVIPRPTYGLYPQVFKAAGADAERVPVDADLRLDLPAMSEAARRLGAKLVVVCDPNNPTGAVVGRAEWETFLAELPAGCAVVVDEAYAEYVDPALRLRREDDVAAGRPVIVFRTFSKVFGIAGLRLGYAIVDEGFEPFLDIVQEPFNVNRAALAAGLASLERVELVEERRVEAAEARTLVTERFEAAGIRVFPSQANFVLADVGVDDRALEERLIRRGFLIRAGSEFDLNGLVRVTVGPAGVMERAATALVEERAALLAA
jgi:histidinol-phosphate aminotransferase